MISKRGFFIVIIFIVLFSGLLAQSNPQPYARNYNTEEGLPSPEVYCAFEDSKGFMWFGTDNGLSRFDGYEFKNYGAQEGLMSNVVFDIYEDVHSRLWIGTLTGEVFILENDTIRPYEFNHLIKDFKDEYLYIGLGKVDSSLTAFFELANFGILKIDKYGNVDTIEGAYNSFMLVAPSNGVEPSIVARINRPKSIEYQRASNLGISSMIEVLKFDKKYKIPINLTTSGVFGRTIDAQQLPSGEIIGYFKQTMFCLKDTQLLWSIPFFEDVTEIITEQDGSIWLCLLNGKGVYHYSDLNALQNNQYDHFLDGLSISHLLKDTKGSYWACSQEKGVFYMPDFELLTFDSRVGLSSDFVSSVAIKNNDELFIGLYNEDIFKINIRQDNATFIGTSLQPCHNACLLYDSSTNKLWGGNYYYEDDQLGRLQSKDRISNGSFYENEPYDNLHFSQSGYLVGAIPNIGIHIIDSKRDTMIYSARSDTLRERVYGLYSDTQNRLWVSKTDGLFEFKDSSYIATPIVHPAFQHRIEDIEELPDSSLVLGSKGFGVIIWKDQDIRQLTFEDGLVSNMIEDIHVDPNGTIWVGTLNGLNKISIDENDNTSIRSFGVSNGLPSNEIYQIDSYGNQVWLCTSKGLVKFHEKPENVHVLPPYIQRVSVNGENTIQDTHEFAYDENNFEIRYLSINFRLDGTVNYRYRINPTNDWQYTQNLTANYPSLTPGTYRFEVQSQNEDQYWSSSSELSFTIAPPWWSSTWFRTLFIISLALTVYLVFRRRVGAIRKENELQQQIKDLEKSALQAQMNPHFMFNSLNSIQNFILKNDRKKAVRFLSRFAKLVRHNLDASIEGEVSLDEEMAMLDNYLALEQERFNHRFAYEIVQSEELENQFIELPTMLVQPFVENAVMHGMANVEADGMIRVAFSKKNDFLQIEVTDNGSGFKDSSLKKKNGSHKSVGMKITKKRLDLLGVHSNNTVEIKEIKNEHKETIGTSVVVLVLLEN